MPSRVRPSLAALLLLVSSAGVAVASTVPTAPQPIDDRILAPPPAGISRDGGASLAPAAATDAPDDDPSTNTELVGIASNYAGTAGWIGQATVAMPGPLGGRYTGAVSGEVVVCADRCARLPVVDWCDCYWGTLDQRIVDLSHAAWALVSDEPLEAGLVDVRLEMDPG